MNSPDDVVTRLPAPRHGQPFRTCVVGVQRALWKGRQRTSMLRMKKTLSSSKVATCSHFQGRGKFCGLGEERVQARVGGPQLSCSREAGPGRVSPETLKSEHLVFFPTKQEPRLLSPAGPPGKCPQQDSPPEHSLCPERFQTLLALNSCSGGCVCMNFIK